MKKRVSYLFFRLVRFLGGLFFPKYKYIGTENIPEGPAVIIGNHALLYGPLVCELYFPGKHKTWTIGALMNLKEVPAYAFNDFWSHKPAYSRWFYRILSYVIAPISVSLFTNADCIGVYHDGRLASTMRQSLAALHDGEKIVIMPECDKAWNNILCEFQQGFADIAALYARKYKEEISFVPMYTAPALRSVYFGKPVTFDSKAPLPQECARICDAMKSAITDIARDLPEHKVVPYANLSKKQYPTNKMVEVAFDQTGIYKIDDERRRDNLSAHTNISSSEKRDGEKQ